MSEGRGMRRSSFAPVVSAVLLLCAQLANSSTAFECEPGLTPRSLTSESSDVTIEWCVDENGLKQGRYRSTKLSTGKVDVESTYVNGQRHGTSRFYDSAGDLFNEVTFEHGREVGGRLTRQALIKTAEAENERQRRMGRPVQVSLVGQRSFLYEYIVPSGSTLLDGLAVSAERRQHLYAETACKFLDIPYAHIERVEMRLATADHVVLETHSFDPAVCSHARSAKP